MGDRKSGFQPRPLLFTHQCYIVGTVERSE